MRHPRTQLFAGAAAAGLLILSACDSSQTEDGAGAAVAQGNNTSGNDSARIADAKDGNWINISGEVMSAIPSSFLLDYGQGTLTVEMDDWDWYQEGKLLKPGDEVVVTGRVDNDLLVNKRLEASSVYVEGLDTYFYASGADEEELRTSAVYVPPAAHYVDYTGTVSAIEGREFSLATRSGSMRIDTTSLSENPLDSDGFQKIEAGDRVFVWGDLDLENAEGAEVKAKGIVSLTPDQAKQDG